MKWLLTVMVMAMGMLALPALVAAAEGTFTATISGDQEVPPVSTSASGSATVTISADDTTVTYKVSYSGLSGDLVASHIHCGPPGVAAGVMLPFAHGPSPFSGTLTQADFKACGDVTTFAGALDAIRAGNTYVNLHTALNPPGEIRGQLKTLPNTATDDPIAPAGSPALLLLAVFAIAAAVAWMRPVARVR
ncbi:MAG TPA: CHRD domain-containing protein [Candidatus Eisenbacteria bacterium]|nr:CHRD domain-containing protein [Candidatus Eisenbacteria bacterium]